jgi:Flp pilus assembly protein CpaB
MSNTTFTNRVSGSMSSRGWAIVLGAAAIVLAAILLIVYLDRYRARVSGENAPTPVLVANKLIPAGTPGTVVASQGMYEASTLPRKEVDPAAIADPQYLTGRAAAADILPGQQFTAADFAASSSTLVKSQLTGSQRAISISVDNIHGSLPQVQAGDSVDIYVALGARSGGSIVKLFKPNVKVLTVPTAAGGNLMLLMDTREVADFAYAADNTQFWFAIRPVVGAKPTVRDTGSAASVLR